MGHGGRQKGYVEGGCRVPGVGFQVTWHPAPDTPPNEYRIADLPHPLILAGYSLVHSVAGRARPYKWESWGGDPASPLPLPERKPGTKTVSAASRARWNLEVIVDGLERLVAAVKTDVPPEGGRDQLRNPFDHAEPGAQDRHERELLPRDLTAHRFLERRFDLDRLERQVLRDLVRHQHRDLVDELLEVTRAGAFVAQDRELVLDQRMRQHCEVGELPGRRTRHGRRSYVFSPSLARGSRRHEAPAARRPARGDRLTCRRAGSTQTDRGPGFRLRHRAFLGGRHLGLGRRHRQR